MRRILTFAIATLAVTSTAQGQTPARQPDYLVWVASEATDRIALVRFGPTGARVEREFTIGLLPTDPDGPHGLAVSPDGRFLFISTAHGQPFGFLWKIEAATGKVLGRVELGYFPATLQLTPDGAFAYVVNFNLHGDMVPSSVSVVETDSMIEVARVATCTMPHGSRINPQGTKQYSACMMDDMVVEIDTRTLGVARRFSVAKGAEQGAEAVAAHTTHDVPRTTHAPSCSPTWAQPSADGARVYVACNKSNEILEIDVDRWTLGRRFAAAEGVYNLAVTHDGRLLVATNKRGQSVSIFDLAAGTEVARVATRRRIVHGVVVSPDDRYAFVSVEGVGAQPGTVEVIDLRTRTSVAAVDVGQMAGGIDFWKLEGGR
ncbi:MAG TPA: YncE family protein [Gemmatimonadales bacterium]|nr:YncE family protein [Gemmatimonadales bacterium]